MKWFISSHRSTTQYLHPPPPTLRKGKLIDDVTADMKILPCFLSSKRSRPPEVDQRLECCRFQAPTTAEIFAISTASRSNFPHWGGRMAATLNIARPGDHQDASHTRPRASTHKHWLLSVSLILASPYWSVASPMEWKVQGHTGRFNGSGSVMGEPSRDGEWKRYRSSGRDAERRRVWDGQSVKRGDGGMEKLGVNGLEGQGPMNAECLVEDGGGKHWRRLLVPCNNTTLLYFPLCSCLFIWYGH